MVVRCCFAGHSKLPYGNDIKNAIYEKCEKLITENKVSEFWIGNYGEFDKMAAITIRDLKHVYPEIILTLIIPYLTLEINQYKQQYYEQYDNIIIAEIPQNTPRQFRIIKCNEYMVDKSDYLISYVKHSFGGAAKTLAYAKRKNKIILQL